MSVKPSANLGKGGGVRSFASGNSAFTLVELLVVIAIIGVLVLFRPPGKPPGECSVATI